MKAPRKYAEGSRIYGWLRASEFAQLKGVDTRTVRAWAEAALTGQKSKLAKADVIRDALGRYWVKGDAQIIWSIPYI